ncbi:MAG: hypothetical protein ACRD8O_02015 [Bryobacteraceae bacterium]
MSRRSAWIWPAKRLRRNGALADEPQIQFMHEAVGWSTECTQSGVAHKASR